MLRQGLMHGWSGAPLLTTVRLLAVEALWKMVQNCICIDALLQTTGLNR